MKWLLRKLSLFFSGTPFIPEGERHWLSGAHYDRYREFSSSLLKGVEHYREYGMSGFRPYYTDDHVEMGYHAKLFLESRFMYLPDEDRRGRRIDNWEVPEINKDGLIINDCDGYAGFVMLLMMVDGVPRENLRIATCWTDKPNGEKYHMVVIVKTPQGDFVIDNTNKYIWRWDKLDFYWHYMEDGKGGFVAIGKTQEKNNG